MKRDDDLWWVRGYYHRLQKRHRAKRWQARVAIAMVAWSSASTLGGFVVSGVLGVFVWTALAVLWRSEARQLETELRSMPEARLLS